MAPFSFAPPLPSLSSSALLSSSFPSYSPCNPTHPLRPDVCIVVLPDGLIVVCISFRPSPALLPRYFRYSAASLAEVPPDPSGLLLREVDCYVTYYLGAVGFGRRL